MAIFVETYSGDGEEWNRYVRTHPDATNYHQFGWKAVVERSFGHHTFNLVARDENAGVRGILPLVFMKSALFGRFLVSLPFFNYGGLLCDTEVVAAQLLNHAKGILEQLDGEYLELRHLYNRHPGLVTREHKVTMILDLAPDSSSQWKNFDSKLRNQIRKAEKSGLETFIGHTELLDPFYEVFARNMRDLGTPVYAKTFFANVLNILDENSRIFAVHLNGKVICAGIACWFRNVIEVPWASSIRDYRSYCPNNLLYWEAIKFAIENGFEKFDFGRSTPGEGTYKFKEQWGARPLQLYWQYVMPPHKPVPELNPHNPKYRAAIRVWQKLPLVLTKIIGPVIVRNIP